MSAAEAMLASDATDLATYKAMVEQEAMKIFEACSFQDITGQRVTKVVTVLRQIEDRVGKLYRTASDGVLEPHVTYPAPTPRSRPRTRPNTPVFISLTPAISRSN